jgi:hypothetical protein
MQKTNIFLSLLLAIFALASCKPDGLEGTGDNTPVERITFTLNSDEPVIAAPDEEVTYNFKIAYSEGLASAKTSLNGEVIEGSEITWNDAPVEADYTFSYTVKGSQFGETLDFVFTATGINGYTSSVDYALWVTANAVEFTANIPEDAPAQIYSNATVGFEVSIECGNILKSIEVTKNGEAFASKTDFTTEKTFKYPFSYTPAAEDIGKDNEFHFVVTDVKGNIAEAYYTVSVIKADAVGKMLYEEIFDTSMSISNTTEYNTTAGGISGNSASEFKPGKIKDYNTMYAPADPENPDSEMVPVPGAMEGCTVYDGDKTSVVYTSDGVDVCLTKYDASSVKNVYGTYMWFRKAKKGWFRADGIKLHGAVSMKLTYSQAGGSIKAEYSIDNGTTWNEITVTKSASEMHEAKFNISAGAETISLRFSEDDGTAHARIDNLKLVEIL